MAFVSVFKVFDGECFLFPHVYDSRWPYFFIFFLILFSNVHCHVSPINRPVPHCQSDRCGEERRFFFYYINLLSSLYSWNIFHNDCNLCWLVCLFLFWGVFKVSFLGVGVVGFFYFYLGGGGVIRFKAYSERHGRYNFRCNIDINSERPTL